MEQKIITPPTGYIYEPVALFEFIEAIIWYKDKDESIAEKFAIDVEEKITVICSDPYRYRQIYKLLREVSLFTFPYYIIYSIDETNKTVIIFSLYHYKRNPKKKYKR